MCSINHDLKAIFIHIPKNGGSFIENILLTHYGFVFDYDIKLNNYGFNHKDDIDFPNISNQNRGVLNYYINSEFINNKYNMTQECWDSYYKFTFVRNPYNKIISAYEFLKENYYNDGFYKVNKSVKFPSLKELFCIQQHGFNSDIYKQSKELYYYHYYHLFIKQTEHLLLDKSKNINIDFIGRTENLDEDIIKILKNLGVTNPYKHLQEINTITNYNSSDYRSNSLGYYFDKELLEFVNNYFKDDFILFKYDIYNNIEQLSDNITFLNKDTILQRQALLIYNNNINNNTEYTDSIERKKK